MSGEGSPPADSRELVAAVEALIFVSDEPLSLDEAREVLGVSDASVRAAVESLRSSYDASPRGLRLEEVAGGLRLTTRPEVAPFLHRFARLRRRRRLSAAALETLAAVAYRQPITAPEIQEIRGVNPDGALRTLLERKLIRVSGRKKVVGRPLLYATTRQFLTHFGLNSLSDLPSLEEFERILALGEAGEGTASYPLEEGGEEAAGAESARPEPPGEE